MPLEWRSYPRVTVVSYSSGMVEEVGEAAVPATATGHSETAMTDEASVPNVDWAAVQLDYEQANGTLTDICKRYGVTEAQLRYRRERHGWTMRNDWGLRVAPLINRMMRVLDGQVRQMEKQMTDPVDKNAALLGTMTKTLEKLIELDEAQRAKRPAQRKEMSDIRNKLVTRIEQLKHGH